MSKIFGHYAFQHYMRVLLERSKQVLPKGINSDAATNVKSQIQGKYTLTCRFYTVATLITSVQ